MCLTEIEVAHVRLLIDARRDVTALEHVEGWVEVDGTHLQNNTRDASQQWEDYTQLAARCTHLATEELLEVETVEERLALEGKQVVHALERVLDEQLRHKQRMQCLYVTTYLLTSE